MAKKVSIPFNQDAHIERESDFSKISIRTSSSGVVTDYSLSTFTGEVLDKPEGSKIFDFTFNTPGNDGLITPTLTAAQTIDLANRTVHYWVKVDDQGYYSGSLIVGVNFVAGTV